MRPQMGEGTRFYGQLGLGFALNPFRVENMISDPTKRAIYSQRGPGNPVTGQLIAYADVGVEILDRLGLQVQLPVIAYQADTRRTS